MNPWTSSTTQSAKMNHTVTYTRTAMVGFVGVVQVEHDQTRSFHRPSPALSVTLHTRKASGWR